MVPDTQPSNSILARVPGQYIARGSRSLPDPATALEEEMSVEIDAGWVGRVRLTYRKHHYRRPKAKFTGVFWCCHHAEPLPPTGQPIPAPEQPAHASCAQP